MKETARLHGIPKKIVSDRDPKLTSKFWKGLFNGVGTNLNFSTADHPKSDGQTERVNQVIKDTLRMYMMDKPSKWVIQVDIKGHPPFPNGSKQFSGHFGNLLFLAGFHFRGHFEGLNEVFSRSRFSMISEGMIEPPK
jgi:hypothetical protein